MRSHLLTASALLAGVLIATNSAGAEPLSPKTFSSVRPETLKFEPFPAFRRAPSWWWWSASRPNPALMWYASPSRTG